MLTCAPQVLTSGQVLVGNASQVLLVGNGLQFVVGLWPWLQVGADLPSAWLVVSAAVALGWLRVWAGLALALLRMRAELPSASQLWWPLLVGQAER